MDNRKERYLNFELLKIISMLFVIMIHFLGHGKVLETAEFNTIEYYIYWFFRAAGYVCVNCFVLITGYFMSNSEVKISKIVKIEIQTIFYTILLWVVTLIISGRNFALKDLLMNITPVSSGIYWYVTVYIMLLVLSPGLNCIVENISRKTFLNILKCLLLYASIIPTFFYWSRNNISKGRDIVWFITLYLMAAYIKKYNVRLKKKFSLLIYLCGSVVLVLSNALIGNATLIILGEIKSADLLYANNSIVVVITSFAFFLFFKEIKIKKTSYSNKSEWLASLSFGAYLFHENIIFREVLWDIIKPARFIDTDFAIIKTIAFMIASVCMIFVIGVILEWLRLKLFKLVGIDRGEHIMTTFIEEKFDIKK